MTLGAQGWRQVDMGGRTGRAKFAVTTRSNSALGAKWGGLGCVCRRLGAWGAVSDWLRVLFGIISNYHTLELCSYSRKLARNNALNCYYTK